jgi:dolichyl-phosphate beta-glucosyltransferase
VYCAGRVKSRRSLCGTIAYKSEPMDLSVVIPVYNGADFIAESVALIHGYLSKFADVDFELILVNDGSTDQTREVLESLKLPGLTVISLPSNQGKFGAIVAGMLAASGYCRIFTDSDIPFDLEAIKYMYDLVDQRSFHLVVGDRSLRDSHYQGPLSLARLLGTPIFTSLVRLLVMGGLHDTQCGIKAFRGDVASAIFPLLRDRGFSGDVELLFVALKYNLEIKRIPVRLRRVSRSSVHVFGHGFRMISRICRLRFLWNSGAYQSEALERLSDQRYWRFGKIDENSVDSSIAPRTEPRETAQEKNESTSLTHKAY